MMSDCFLLSRVLLRFDEPAEEIKGNLSAAATSPDGYLWLGSDEGTAIERLSPLEPFVFGTHQPFNLGDFISLFNQEDEIDIEGMDYADNYLWFTGSHSTKRKKTKGKKTERDLERLLTIATEPNRYVLGRVPAVGGVLHRICVHPKQPDIELTAAQLQTTGETNILLESLRADPHLGPFLTFPLPSKENGFDIEGLAVHANRLFLGFRGPVLRGWAIIVEIEVEEQEQGVLTLKQFDDIRRSYRKHFVDLDGLGIRELILNGDDLIILAGPTMTLAGLTRIYRLKNALSFSGDTVSSQQQDNLEVIGDLPWRGTLDNAEGMAHFPCLNQPDALLVVYDAPDLRRIPAPNQVFADVFMLP
jgi:hypothetical protein